MGKLLYNKWINIYRFYQISIFSSILSSLYQRNSSLPKGDENIEQIVQLDTENIKQINLDKNIITPKGLRLMQGLNWKNLTYLSLADCKLSNKGCKYLSRITFSAISYMNLSGCRIQSSGITHISKIGWKTLKEISLKQNKIIWNGIKSLIRMNQNLSIISVRFNKIPFEQLLHFLLLEGNQASLHVCKLKDILGSHKGDKRNQDRINQLLKLKFIKLQ